MAPQQQAKPQQRRWQTLDSFTAPKIETTTFRGPETNLVQRSQQKVITIKTFETGTPHAKMVQAYQPPAQKVSWQPEVDRTPGRQAQAQRDAEARERDRRTARARARAEERLAHLRIMQATLDPKYRQAPLSKAIAAAIGAALATGLQAGLDQMMRNGITSLSLQMSVPGGRPAALDVRPDQLVMTLAEQRRRNARTEIDVGRLDPTLRDVVWVAARAAGYEDWQINDGRRAHLPSMSARMGLRNTARPELDGHLAQHESRLNNRPTPRPDPTRDPRRASSHDDTDPTPFPR